MPNWKYYLCHEWLQEDLSPVALCGLRPTRRVSSSWRLAFTALTSCGSLILLSLSLLGCNKSQIEISFSALQPAERLEVEFESIGCFHNERFKFTFFGDNPKRVEVLGTGISSNTHNATLPLTDEDLRKLDNMLFMYRLGVKGSCTTSEQIKLHLNRGGNQIASEEYIDKVCACSQVQGLLTLGWIAQCAKDGVALSSAPVNEGSIHVDEIREAMRQRSTSG